MSKKNGTVYSKTYCKPGKSNPDGLLKQPGKRLKKVAPIVQKVVKFDKLFLLDTDDDSFEPPSLAKEKKENSEHLQISSDGFSISANDTFDAVARMKVDEGERLMKIRSPQNNSSSSYAKSDPSASVSLDMFTSSPVPQKKIEVKPKVEKTSTIKTTVPSTANIKTSEPLITLPSTTNIKTSEPLTRLLTSTPTYTPRKTRLQNMTMESINGCSPLSKESSVFEMSMDESTRFPFKPGKDWRRSYRSTSRMITLERSAYVTALNTSQYLDLSETSFLQCNAAIPELESDPRDFILRLCLQEVELPFAAAFKSRLSDCRKIGEGLYGEVFLYEPGSDDEGFKSVLKIIPIEGDLIVNDERQKTYAEISAEIVVSKALSDLDEHDSDNATSNFAKMHQCWCVKGSYPSALLDSWDRFNDKKGSENDRPDVFPDSQVYIVLEAEFAGCDLEAYVFNNAMQAYTAFLQVAYALAVSEEALEFEHRDLHWGNVLIMSTTESSICYNFGGQNFNLKTQGIKATIIDFTLSRMVVDGKTYFNDLSVDPTLFQGEGDYQFDVYRKMRENNGDDWEKFAPKTNIFWLGYLARKMMKECYYKNKSTKIHKEGMSKLRKALNILESFSSASKYVLSLEES